MMLMSRMNGRVFVSFLWITIVPIRCLRDQEAEHKFNRASRRALSRLWVYYAKSKGYHCPTEGSSMMNEPLYKAFKLCRCLLFLLCLPGPSFPTFDFSSPIGNICIVTSTAMFLSTPSTTKNRWITPSMLLCEAVRQKHSTLQWWAYASIESPGSNHQGHAMYRTNINNLGFVMWIGSFRDGLCCCISPTAVVP